MNPLWLLAVLSGTLYIWWIARYYRKHGTLSFPKKKYVRRKAVPLQGLSASGYDKRNTFKQAGGLNKTFKFKLVGHLEPKTRKYLKEKAYDYMPVTLEPQKGNAAGPDTIGVKDKQGLIIGYAPVDAVIPIRALLDGGITYTYVYFTTTLHKNATDNELPDITIGIDYYFPAETS